MFVVIFFKFICIVRMNLSNLVRYFSISFLLCFFIYFFVALDYTIHFLIFFMHLSCFYKNRVKNIGAVIKYHNKSFLTAFFKIFYFVIFLSKLP